MRKIAAIKLIVPVPVDTYPIQTYKKSSRQDAGSI